MKRNGKRKGSTLIEFTLVAVPMIFALISAFEIARGMWIYGTIANAVKEGVRFAIVKGSDCSAAPNACSARISDIAARIHNMGPGLLPSEMNVTFTSDSGSISCRMDSCLTTTTVWPPAGDNAKGQQLQILAKYPFRSAIVMFWPGAGRPVTVGTVNLAASSQEVVQF